MEAKHSEGPWEIDCNGVDDFLVMENDSFIPIRNSQPRWIGFVDASGLDANADEEFANARLIAAAPDLLAALEAVGGHLDEATLLSGETKDLIRQAIAKARGEEGLKEIP